MKITGDDKIHLKVIIIILVGIFSSSIFSQPRFFDKYRSIYEDALKKNTVVLNDWIEKQIFTLEEKEYHLKEYIRYTNFLDSLIFANNLQAAREYSSTLTSENVLKYQKLLYYFHYYLPVEYYHYWTERLKLYLKGEINSPGASFNNDLLDYIKKNISYLNYCIIGVPYILVVHVDEIIPETINSRKWILIKGKILKDLKGNRTFNDNRLIEFLTVYYPRPNLTSYYYDNESECEDVNVPYNPSDHLRAGSDYIFFIGYVLGGFVEKYSTVLDRTPLHITSLKKNGGIFEIKDGQIIDPYNFFGLGKNPSLDEIEKLLRDRISEITGGN